MLVVDEVVVVVVEEDEGSRDNGLFRNESDLLLTTFQKSLFCECLYSFSCILKSSFAIIISCSYEEYGKILRFQTYSTDRVGHGT